MWVQAAGTGETPIVLFDYDPTRSGKVPRRLLEGFQGYLQTDAYAGYNRAVDELGLVWVLCMAHARRHFVDALKAGGDDDVGREERCAGRGHEPPAPVEEWWGRHFDVVEVDDVWAALGRPPRAAYLREETERAAAADLEPAPARLRARREWRRALKTGWEVHCLETAMGTAAAAHEAARARFEAGASELQIHHAFVQAAGCTEAELPYPTIVALDEKGAILHYEKKRHPGSGRVLLIDAGTAHRGYAADVTRTHVRGAEPRFRELRDGVERLQQGLCAGVRPGLSFGELHHQAHLAVAELLARTGLVRADPEEAVAREWRAVWG